MKFLKLLVKNETVFCVSFLLAVLSSLIIRPDAEYLAYPDYHTIALLFCLMIIVAGFQSLGIFAMLGHFLLEKAGGIRRFSAVMVVLCFFSSMVITNDVALITFVPFTLLVLRMGGRVQTVLKIVVLETIAANLGSMATPIGNPQNLYLYSVSGLTAGEFARAVLPYSAIAFGMLMVIVFTQREVPLLDVVVKEKSDRSKKEILRGLIPYLILLFAVCILGYLWYNATPSRLMMGDAGSRAMGLFISIAVLKTGSPFLYIPVALVLILDGGLGLVKVSLLRFLKIRILTKVRTPLHDQARKVWEWSNTQTVFRFAIIQIIVSVAVVYGIQV